ncbi:autotransporter outer membrane beta-barrel domain-containing protein [Labrys okinawensis]|uniref:autotransporter family protein n=1 Tax=Labrys okinawensis TaxID=346911 RepID=UPI0039BCFC4E
MRPLGRAIGIILLTSTKKRLLTNVCCAALMLAWAVSPAWAGGGIGSGATVPNVGTSNPGTGGVDGSPASATGKDATTIRGGNVVGGGGGGGATDLTTGNGAAGGAGGLFYTGGSVTTGTAGTTGTTGVQLTAPTSVLSTTVSGGTGGAGPLSVPNTSTEGGGGGGGVGASAVGDVEVIGTGAVTGGSGSGAATGGGGGGGTGLFSSASVIVDAGGTVTGGAGGSGRTSGGGGEGGTAVILTNGGTLANNSTLTGGVGGTSMFGAGGDGGAGVQMLNGGTVVNGAGASITGGAGGVSPNRTFGFIVSPGRGGVGISGANLTVVNAGTIAGGLSGAARTGTAPIVQANAIQFTGGVNSLEIQAGSTISGNVVAFSAADTLKLGGGTDASFDVSAIGAAAQYQGFGNFEKTGTSTWALTGSTTYSGNVTVAQGTLQAGAANIFTAGAAFTVDAGARLDLAGFDQTVVSLTNAGTVSLNGAPGTQLTVTGNYVGQGGTIVLNTVLGNDSSLTDRLVVNGNVSGNTLLDIRNVGGLGAQTVNGIDVVQVDGTSTVDAFSLTHAVAVGAFDYGLFRGADQDWYLRSVNVNGSPGLNPSAQTARPYADILGNYALASLGTLAQRDGNRIWPDGTPPQLAADLPPAEAMRYAPAGPAIYGAGAWGRIVGQYSSYDPKAGSSYTQSLGFTQAGYEGTAYESAAGDLSLGGYATIGTSRADIDLTRDPVTGAARGSAHITSTGYGLGGTMTWLGSDGFYADGIGQFTWYDSDLSNQTTGDDEGWSTALSLGVGKRFTLGSGWAVVPQAQLAWTHVDFDSFIDENGSLNELGKGDSLRGRGGLRLEKLDTWKGEDGQVRRVQLYGVANLSYEFLDGTSVEVDSTEIDQQEKKLWGEIGLGGTYAWNDEWSLNGEASYGAALASNAGSNYAVKGTVGLRYRW